MSLDEPLAFFKIISEGNHWFFIGNHPDPSWRGRLLKASQNKTTVVYIYISLSYNIYIYKNIWWVLSFIVLSVLIMLKNNVLEHEWQLRTKKNSSVRCYCSIFLGLLFLCRGRRYISGMLTYPISWVIGLIVGSIPMNHHKDQIPFNHLFSIG